MSVCAVMLVKDEADIVGYTVEYLLGQVDHLIVADNGSTDGTSEILASYPVEVWNDPEPGYYQAQKTTDLAARAREQGHQWVIPVDADELWYATDGRTLRQYLGGLAPDVAFVAAPLYNHLPTGHDRMDVCPQCGNQGWYMEPGPDPATPNQAPCEVGEPNPFLRVGWRQREHGALPKVCARLREGLEIRQGNHAAYAPGAGLTVGGLVVRHFSWRTADQYVRKIRNGYIAYAATNLDEGVGAHWRMFGAPDEPTFDERVADHFRTWFWIENPDGRDDLIFDPAPYAPEPE